MVREIPFDPQMKARIDAAQEVMKNHKEVREYNKRVEMIRTWLYFSLIGRPFLGFVPKNKQKKGNPREAARKA